MCMYFWWNPHHNSDQPESDHKSPGCGSPFPLSFPLSFPLKPLPFPFLSPAIVRHSLGDVYCAFFGGCGEKILSFLVAMLERSKQRKWMVKSTLEPSIWLRRVREEHLCRPVGIIYTIQAWNHHKRFCTAWTSTAIVSSLKWWHGPIIQNFNYNSALLHKLGWVSHISRRQMPSQYLATLDIWYDNMTISRPTKKAQGECENELQNFSPHYELTKTHQHYLEHFFKMKTCHLPILLIIFQILAHLDVDYWLRRPAYLQVPRGAENASLLNSGKGRQSKDSTWLSAFLRLSPG